MRFLDLKQQVDKIIKTDDLGSNRDVLLKNLMSYGNEEILSYLFQQVKGQKWFDYFYECNLLIPLRYIRNNTVCFRWPALLYLQRIVGTKEREITRLIDTLQLDEGQKLDYVVLEGILQLLLKFKNKENILTIFNKIMDGLNEGIELPSYFNVDNLIQFIAKLKSLKCTNKAFNLLEAVLSLKIISEQTLFSKGKEYYVVPRFQNNDKVMENYLYHKLIEKSLILIKNKTDVFSLFKVYYNILNNLSQEKVLTLDEQNTLNWRICFRRSAIEDNSQNININEPISDVINMVRDLSAKIIDCNSLQIRNKIINLLKNGNGDIFKRVLLYLAQRYPTKLRRYISDVLPKKNYFTGTSLSVNIYHEYYGLLKQEFKNLSKKKQDIILEYISKGPKRDADMTQDDIEYWQFKKLYPISESLSGSIQQDYQRLNQKFGKDMEHPEFLHYTTSFIGFPSPKTEEELSLMSIEQIVDFLKIWKPEHKGPRSPDRSGLSDTLAKDIQKRPLEYLKQLHLFKEINEPTYIYSLLNTLSNTNQIAQYFSEISDIISWTLTKENDPPLKKDNIFEGMRDWKEVYKAAMHIYSSYFHSLIGNGTLSQDSIDAIENAYQIIQKVTLMRDSWLEQPMPADKPLIEYFQRAINSLHGDAMTALFQYGMWQNRLIGQKNLNNVCMHLERVIKENSYPETYAVIGRHLPWIKSMDEKWFADNLDKLLLPEDNNEIFDVTWLCYVHFVNPYSEMYTPLRKKFIHALNRNYTEKEDNSDNGGTVMHLAMYYGRGDIALNDEIFDLLFQKDKDTFQGVSLLNYIGRSLRNENNQKLDQVYYERFKNLWTKYKTVIAQNEKNHVEGLKAFEHWYASGVFEQKWALNELYTIVCTQNIILQTYGLIDQLNIDVDCDPIQVVDIIEKIITNSNNDLFDIANLELLFRKIEEKSFNDASLKSIEVLKKIINTRRSLDVCLRLQPILESFERKLNIKNN